MLKGEQFVDCNEAMVKILGFEKKADLLYTHPADTSPEYQPNGATSIDQAQKMIRAVHHKGTHLFEWMHLKTDGSLVPVEIAMTAMPSSEGTILLAVLRDISDRKQAEKERASLEAQLRQSQKMDAVGQLAGGVAHDLNNLLQAITGYSEIALLEMSPNNKVRQDLAQVLKAAGSASDLVRQLLAFSRLQTLSLDVIDLNEVIEDFSKMIRRIIGEDIEFITIFKPGGVTIKADKGQIEQVLMNLCVNGRDAMVGGGKLTVVTSNVDLGEAFCEENAWARPGRYVLLSVTDTGHGMDEATQERIFEPFFTSKEAGKGTGLGLSTVYGIVRQHLGMVRVQSTPGKGTTFNVFLPFCDEAPLADHKEEQQHLPTGTEVILLAEDDEAVRTLARKYLETAGYTVLIASDGQTAIDLYDAHRESIALAVLDVMMPGKSGREVAEHIRRDRDTTPVLFVSGYSSGTIHSDYISKHNFKLLIKPYRLEEILSAVRHMLDQESS